MEETSKDIVQSKSNINARTASVESCVRIIGAKWTILIINSLLDGPRRFSELERSCPGISPRALSLRLKMLRENRIIMRKSYLSEPGIRIEYELTDRSKAFLTPIIEAMSNFGQEWIPK